MKTLFSRGRCRGFTLAEMMVGATVSLILAAVVVTGAYIIQKNFIASARYAKRQSQQARLLDFMALDLRRALTVAMTNGDLSLTIPDYYTSSGDIRDPIITAGKVYYGGPTASIPVRYYKSGSAVFRVENGVTLTIAEDVQDFQLTFHDEGQVIEASVSFLPTFQNNGNGVRDGTTVYARTLLRNKRQL